MSAKAGMDPPGSDHAFLSTAPLRPWDRRAAAVIVALSLVVLGFAVPYATAPWPEIPAFIPAYAAILFICDTITALLLIGQFQQSRSRAVLVLGTGYLFTALIVVAHALSFPGLFAPGGLIGGRQTTVWLFIFWHGLFPLFVIAYALLAGRDETAIPEAAVGRAMLAGCLGGAGLALACAMAATIGHDLLPVLMDGNQYRPGVTKEVLSLTWIAALVALAILAWRTRLRRIIDLWLAVVMAAWVVEILLSALLNNARFQVGFYVGRIYGVLAAGFVLAVLLHESVTLYGRLVRSLAEARARAADLARSEAALRQAQKMEAVGQLTGGIAHDFNNLLTVVIGSLERLRYNPGVPAPALALAASALQAAERGERLTQQLLSFARRQLLRPETVNANRVLLDIGELIRQGVGQAVEVDFALDPALHPARVDPAEFETAILNLVVNARDAIAAVTESRPGRLTVSTRNADIGFAGTPGRPEETPGAYAVIAVGDNGIGIEAANHERVFEPFFTTKEIGKGSGLGLSQVYGFVKQSGGHMRLHSQPGVGTTIELWLPRSMAEAEPVSLRAQPVPLGRAAPGEVVLVVDDDPDVRLTATESLAELGYQILVAADAAEALEVLRGSARIDILFADVVMPGGMNGLQLATEARRLRPVLKVLLTSGYTAPDAEGRDELRLPFLRKPYRREELATQLRVVLGDRQ